MEIIGAMPGLERIAIIGGAMLMAYWGFRLFAISRAPGYIFMGLGAALLVGTLMTGSSQLSSPGASQLPVAADQDATPEAEAQPADRRRSPITEPRTPSETGDPDEAEQQTLIAEVETQVEDDTASATSDAVATADDALELETPATTLLLSSEALGGRIVSVKSEQVTLEWSREG